MTKSFTSLNLRLRIRFFALLIASWDIFGIIFGQSNEKKFTKKSIFRHEIIHIGMMAISILLFMYYYQNTENISSKYFRLFKSVTTLY